MNPSPRNTKSGFSLIEVIVAMGIVATVMVGLIGILPTGVNSLHDASKVAIQSRIVQEMVSDAQQSNWDTASKAKDPNAIPQPMLSEMLGVKNMRRYDAQGNLISGVSVVGQVPAYAALMLLDTTNNNKPQIMGYATGYSHLRRVFIYVEYTPGGRAPNPTDPSRAKFVTKYSLLVANMGTSESLN